MIHQKCISETSKNTRAASTASREIQERTGVYENIFESKLRTSWRLHHYFLASATTPTKHLAEMVRNMPSEDIKISGGVKQSVDYLPMKKKGVDPIRLPADESKKRTKVRMNLLDIFKERFFDEVGLNKYYVDPDHMEAMLQAEQAGNVDLQINCIERRFTPRAEIEQTQACIIVSCLPRLWRRQAKDMQ